MIKTLHTGLYSDFAYLLISKSMYHISRVHRGSTARGILVNRDINNEVVLNNDTSTWRSHRNFLAKAQNEHDARIWLARNIKHVSLDKLSNVEACHSWNRFNGEINDRLSITPTYGELYEEAGCKEFKPTFQQTYLIYEIIAERKNIEAKYSGELIDEVRGHELDPLAAELEQIKRNEIAACRERYKKDLAALNPSEWNSKASHEIEKELQELRAKRIAEWQKRYDEVEAKMNAEINEIKRMAAFATANASEFPFSA